MLTESTSPSQNKGRRCFLFVLLFVFVALFAWWFVGWISGVPDSYRHQHLGGVILSTGEIMLLASLLVRQGILRRVLLTLTFVFVFISIALMLHF